MVSGKARRSDSDDRCVGRFRQTATRDNASWYERSAFEVVRTYRPTLSWPDVWAMWRTRGREKVTKPALEGALCGALGKRGRTTPLI